MTGVRLRDERARFAGELLLAMAKRDVTTRALAEALGMTQHQVVNWRTGMSLPFVATARRLADALDWPDLAHIVRAARTFRCLGCGRQRVSEGTGSQRRYCDDNCETIAKKAGRGGRLQTPEAIKLRRFGDAVDAMCMSCEPEGVCGDASCPLRGVSPLPCSDKRPVAVPKQGRKFRWDRPGERERAAARMREIHQTKSDWRARISEWNRQRWANLTPDERADLGHRIAAGRRRSGKVAA